MKVSAFDEKQNCMVFGYLSKINKSKLIRAAAFLRSQGDLLVLHL